MPSRRPNILGKKGGLLCWVNADIERSFHRTNGGAKAEDGRHFRYQNRDDPSYQKPYGKEYTVKQLKIMSGEVEWETTPLNQLTMLLYKAEMLNDTEVYNKVKEMRDRRIEQRDKGYRPNMTIEEAKDILRSLTPWGNNK